MASITDCILEHNNQRAVALGAQQSISAADAEDAARYHRLRDSLDAYITELEARTYGPSAQTVAFLVDEMRQRFGSSK